MRSYDLSKMSDKEIADLVRGETEADQCVFMLMVRRSGVGDVFDCCENCSTDSGDLPAGPARFVMWRKYSAPGSSDPCIEWVDSSGNRQKRCW